MSNISKAKQLRDLTDAELASRMDELAAEAMKLRFQQATMQMSNTARPSRIRREIARIKTVMAERARQGVEA